MENKLNPLTPEEKKESEALTERFIAKREKYAMEHQPDIFKCKLWNWFSDAWASLRMSESEFNKHICNGMDGNDISFTKFDFLTILNKIQECHEDELAQIQTELLEIKHKGELALKDIELVGMDNGELTLRMKNKVAYEEEIEKLTKELNESNDKVLFLVEAMSKTIPQEKVEKELNQFAKESDVDGRGHNFSFYEKDLIDLKTDLGLIYPHVTGLTFEKPNNGVKQWNFK